MIRGIARPLFTAFSFLLLTGMQASAAAYRDNLSRLMDLLRAALRVDDGWHYDTGGRLACRQVLLEVEYLRRVGRQLQGLTKGLDFTGNDILCVPVAFETFAEA